jgi:hypothetical protein
MFTHSRERLSGSGDLFRACDRYSTSGENRCGFDSSRLLIQASRWLGKMIHL